MILCEQQASVVAAPASMALTLETLRGQLRHVSLLCAYTCITIAAGTELYMPAYTHLQRPTVVHILIAVVHISTITQTVN
jgi:argininosuccinate lyase